MIVNRTLGTYDAGAPGPILFCTGALHGNEPAGVRAIERVLEALAARRPRLWGRFIGVAGNLAALSAGRRFLARDLNRGWFAEHLRALRAQDPAQDSPEDAEQRALLSIIERVIDEADRPVVFLDLHSTSGAGAPFSCMADTLRNRLVAFALPVPVILGLEETIDGTMLGYLHDLGHVAVSVEGGQHEDPATAAHHEAVIWLALAAAGCLAEADVPDAPALRALLRRASGGAPRVVEIRHRHVVRPGDEFRMEPGFASFQPVRAGQVLARDRRGPVLAPEDGRVLMPLYQPQGEDGFFLARDVWAGWLWLSGALRRGGADRLVPYLPGVRRHPEREDHLVVDPQAPMAVDVMHLFGYRRRREEEAGLVYSRRRPEARGRRR
jgi:succinylglutamate desuccinylase